jgi:ABC-type antimicrobial peptide transport system ATPase subunit
VATLSVPNKTARIRLKLSKKNKRALKKALRKKKRVALTLRLSVGVAGGPQKPYSKKVVVKRPKKKHARRH